MLCFCCYNNIIIRQSKYRQTTLHTALAMLIIIAGISAYIICVFMTFDHTRSTSILAPTMYMTVYCTFLCVSGLLSIATGIEPVDVKVTVDKSTGSFQISLQGQEWLRSGAVGVRNGGQWWRSDNKDHYLLKQDNSLPLSGQDAFGEFDTTA